jgi:hypothetical protein
MVIFSAVGEASIFIRETVAKRAIRKIENDNGAIRAELLNKVQNNRARITGDEKREQALLELRTENPLFGEAIDSAIRKLLPRP